MWPLELVATATDSPRYSPAGSFNKFGAEVNGISGTFSMVALRWLNAGAAASTATAADNIRIRFMGISLNGPIGITILMEAGRDSDAGQEMDMRGAAGRPS